MLAGSASEGTKLLRIAQMVMKHNGTPEIKKNNIIQREILNKSRSHIDS